MNFPFPQSVHKVSVVLKEQVLQSVIKFPHVSQDDKPLDGNLLFKHYVHVTVPALFEQILQSVIFPEHKLHERRSVAKK